MCSDMKLDHVKVVKKTNKQTHRQRLANYNIDDHFDTFRLTRGEHMEK